MKLLTEQLLAELVQPEVCAVVTGYFLGIIVAGALAALLLYDVIKGFFVSCVGFLRMLVLFTRKPRFLYDIFFGGSERPENREG